MIRRPASRRESRVRAMGRVCTKEGELVDRARVCANSPRAPYDTHMLPTALHSPSGCSSTCPTCPYPPTYHDGHTCIIIQHCFRGLQKTENLQSRDESTPRNRYGLCSHQASVSGTARGGSCSHQKSELLSYFAHEIVRSPSRACAMGRVRTKGVRVFARVGTIRQPAFADGESSERGCQCALTKVGMIQRPASGRESRVRTKEGELERHLCSLIDPCCSSTCPTCPYPPTCGLQKKAPRPTSPCAMGRVRTKGVKW